MKNFLLFLAFILSFIIAYYLGKMSVSEPKEKIIYVNAKTMETKECIDSNETNTIKVKQPNTIQKSVVSNGLFAIPSSIEAATKIIDRLDETFIENRIESMIGITGSDAIYDKRAFAKSIAQIYFEDNSSIDRDIVGNTHSFVSKSKNIESRPIYELQLDSKNRRKRLYVHILLDSDYLEKIGAVFIKWENSSTGETLLFTRKAININSLNNWVSFLPDNGWKKGDYHVKIFEFSDRLLPISKAEYTIY